MPWTRFLDVNSGGSNKLGYAFIFIEAAESDAVEIFTQQFGRSPFNVTCTCCGPDFSMNEEDTLEEASRYWRTTDHYTKDERIQSMEEFAQRDDVLIVRSVKATTFDGLVTRIDAGGDPRT